MAFKLSVIIPTLSGEMPKGILDDPRLEVVLVKGVSPVGKARNEGLRRATGEYVAWVDADDEVADSWLDEIFAALEKEPDVVTLDATLVGWQNRNDGVWGVTQKEATIDRLRRDVYRDISRSSALWLYVAKRSLWEGLAFDEDVRVAEDYLLLPKMLARANSCVYIDKKIYRYNCTPESLMNTRSFEHDVEVVELWVRRFKGVERKYRGECLWGMCVSCYWLFDGIALGGSETNVCFADECAARCREVIRQNLFGCLREAVFGYDLSLKDRLTWSLRFICAAMDWWLPQKVSRIVRGRTK